MEAGNEKCHEIWLAFIASLMAEIASQAHKDEKVQFAAKAPITTIKKENLSLRRHF